MPYKRKKDQAKYQRQYSGFRAKRNSDLRKAVMKGDFAKAKRVVEKKPHIHIKKRRAKK